MEDTRGVQVEIGRSQEELQRAQRTVAEHEARTKRLEGELSALSSRLNEDYLTQLMNRRGLARAFQQEATRSDLGEGPMCVALLDIDNFKHLNDRLGHAVGDQALVHLSRVLRESIRPTDSIARWGGEEFVILLPETGVDGALRTMARVQRALTRRYYLHNHERVLITFSAGIAQRQPGETAGSRRRARGPGAVQGEGRGAQLRRCRRRRRARVAVPVEAATPEVPARARTA